MRLIVEVRPEIRAILISGHSDQELKRVGLAKVPHVPFLKKPLTPETLVEKVCEVLGSSC
jgi:two-component SAPR family response regulator